MADAVGVSTEPGRRFAQRFKSLAVGQVLQGFSQRGRCVDDDLLERDHGDGSRFHRGIASDFELAHHLNGPIGGLRRGGRLAGQHRAGGGLGVESVALPGRAA